MKKTLSVLCLFAMLLSLAAVMTVGTSAVYADDGRTATYVVEAPTIDGEMDDAYKHAKVNKMSTRGDYRVLWDDTGIYMFVNLIQTSSANDKLYVEVFVSGVAYTMDTAVQFWKDYKGDYYFRCAPDGELNVTTDGTISKPTCTTWHGAGAKLPAGFQSKVKKTGEKTFQAEFYIPMASNDWNIAGGAGKSRIGFGVKACGNNWITSGMTLDSSGACASPNPYALKAIILGKESECQFPLETEPTLTTKGHYASACTICGKANPSAEIPETTIEYLGHQVQETIPAGATTTSMRLVSQIKDLEAFSKVGYEIAATMGTSLENMTEVGKLEAEMDVVYKSIKAGTETVLPENGGEYLAAIVVTDIPRYAEDGTTPLYVTFTVKPYTVNPDGTRNYMTGTNSFTFTLKAGQPAV